MQPITNAYIAQVHKCINTTTFSFVLSRHPPEPAEIFKLDEIAQENYVNTDQRYLTLNLQRKVAAPQAEEIV